MRTLILLGASFAAWARRMIRRIFCMHRGPLHSIVVCPGATSTVFHYQCVRCGGPVARVLDHNTQK